MNTQVNIIKYVLKTFIPNIDFKLGFLEWIVFSDLEKQNILKPCVYFKLIKYKEGFFSLDSDKPVYSIVQEDNFVYPEINLNKDSLLEILNDAYDSIEQQFLNYKRDFLQDNLEVFCICLHSDKNFNLSFNDSCYYPNNINKIDDNLKKHLNKNITYTKEIILNNQSILLNMYFKDFKDIHKIHHMFKVSILGIKV